MERIERLFKTNRHKPCFTQKGNSVIYDIITPVYNFIINRLADESVVLKPL